MAWADAVWIDVRTAVEHAVDNIDGDDRITHDEIVEGVSERYPDKATEIHLYCRSGALSRYAEKVLKAMGYTKAVNKGSLKAVRKEQAAKKKP